MTSADLYRWLMASAASGVCQQFDAHVVACVLSMAFSEASQGRSLCAAVGLAPEELAELASSTFPHAAPLFAGLDRTQQLELAEDEKCLRDLLSRSSSERTRLEQLLAYIIARRALSPNHLWQDLGLRNRRELSWLMARHFEPLATRNAHDMKWKKFLYRTICRDQSFTLCVAPSCAECTDFDDCFGDESGESLLPIARRDADKATLSGGRLGEPVAKPTILP